MNKKELKVLYFEGAGMNTYESGEDVGNHRIRTAFLNNEGKAIYLEIIGHKFNNKKCNYWQSHIDYVFYIPGSGEEEKKYLHFDNFKKEGYTKEKIIKWINENLNCNFDTMLVLPRFEGYRVHADEGGYNLIDNHKVNLKRAAAREEAYNKIDLEYRKKLNSKYSVIHLLKLEESSLTVRCYASKEQLKAAGLTDKDREIKIEINY